MRSTGREWGRDEGVGEQCAPDNTLMRKLGGLSERFAEEVTAEARDLRKRFDLFDQRVLSHSASELAPDSHSPSGTDEAAPLLTCLKTLDPEKCSVDGARATVLASGSASAVFGYRLGCPLGRKAYFEVTIGPTLPRLLCLGFATATFHRGAGRRGEEEEKESWTVEAGAKRHAGRGAYKGVWRAGDVVGVACDLEGGQALCAVT